MQAVNERGTGWKDTTNPSGVWIGHDGSLKERATKKHPGLTRLGGGYNQTPQDNGACCSRHNRHKSSTGSVI